jgi:hypothetical protein
MELNILEGLVMDRALLHGDSHSLSSAYHLSSLDLEHSFSPTAPDG